MKIYTKTGDKGDTQVYADDVLKLRKDDQILECYGTLDELNAHTGLLISLIDDKDTNTQLAAIQRSLFQIGFAISAQSQLEDNDIRVLETQIDVWQEALPPQTQFILPGGNQAAAQAHVCRTVARRAERQLVRLAADRELPGINLRYINRLSDYLFTLARHLNNSSGGSDVFL